MTCGIKVSTRRKKNLPHVHKAGQCFSVEHFPETLPFDPMGCQKVASPEVSDAEPRLQQAPVAAPDAEQIVDELLEDVGEDILE